MDPQGKVALVTGGASGIGLACVEQLLANGAKAAVCDMNDEAGECAVKTLAELFGNNKVIFIKMDVRDQTSFEAAFKTTTDTFQGVDIVINSAGIHNVSNWKDMIAVNLNGVLQGTMLAFQHMDKTSGGRGGVVINVSSIFGLESLTQSPIYAATKHGVVGFSRSYGTPLHYDRSGVRVLTICPGVTDTPLTKGASIPKELSCQKVEDVAKGVLHIIRHASNGSVWVSEGGEPVYEVRFLPRKEMQIST